MRNEHRLCILLLLAAAVLAPACVNQTSQTSSAVKRPAAAPPLLLKEERSPAAADSRDPELFAAADGRLIMSWIEKTGEGRHALRFAVRDAAGWSETRTAAEGDNWFVNWADFPSVVALGDGSLAAHWLVKNGGSGYTHDVNVSLSKDGGKTWSRPVAPHTDGTQTEHGFVSLIPLRDGRLGAVWVDGRAAKDMQGHEGGGPSPVNTQLRYAALDADGRLSDEQVLDDRTCECCQTSAAMTSEGPIAAYRDRSESEVRDIHFVRLLADGWSAPRPVHADNWQIKACPINGPSVAADGRRVAVAWFTGEGDSARVEVAFSSDAGATFGEAARVDDGGALGRVDVVLLGDGSALVCWMSGDAEGGANKVRRIAADGSPGPVAVIATADVSRSSGFPRMARLGDTVYFAWTQFGKPPQVHTATADVSAFK